MKTTFTLILTLLFTVNVSGQTIPDCNYLTVEDIYIDSTGDLAITISNSCSTCASGQNGCVYMELKMIRTVSPFDTIAESNCSCLISPENNSSNTYYVNTAVSVVPPTSDFSVSLTCGSEGCDTIPFSLTSGILSNELSHSIYIYPNPFSSSTSLQTEHFLHNATLTIYNSFGQIVKHIKNTSGQTINLHRDNLPSGLYFIWLIQDSKVIATNKFVITD
jgi:hypothetical protein